MDGSFPVVEAHVRYVSGIKCQIILLGHFGASSFDDLSGRILCYIRMYVVTQKSPIPIPLRLVIPNDLGAMLYLSLPSQVVHAMDAYSPMVPKSKLKCLASPTVPQDGLNLRQIDGSTNNRDDVCCPVCGESYGTAERFIKHGKYQQMMETHDGVPMKGSHREVDWDEWETLMKKSTTWSLTQLEAFFRSDISEILCIVEGIDPIVSGTFQAIQSYQYEDIHFGEAHFADCVCLDTQGSLVVDLGFFHKITDGLMVPAPHSHPVDDSEISIKRAMDEIKEGKVAQGTANLANAMASRGRPDSAEKENRPKATRGTNLEGRSASTPDDPTTPSKTQDEEESELEPRHLKYGAAVHPPEQQTPYGDLVAPPPRVIQTDSTRGEPSSPATTPTPQQSVPVSSSETNSNVIPLLMSNEQPPPLVRLDNELQGKGLSLQDTGRQPSIRSSMPGNMMNSLITGKF